MKEIYREAFAEVNEIFKLMPEMLLNKIPNRFKEMIENELSTNYVPKIQEPLEEYKLKEETIIVLALIYRDFLCSNEEKEKLKLRDAQKLKEFEEELREKYNPNDIFKKRKHNVEMPVDENLVHETRMTIVEEKWYNKIVNIIKNFFKKK